MIKFSKFHPEQSVKRDIVPEKTNLLRNIVPVKPIPLRDNKAAATPMLRREGRRLILLALLAVVSGVVNGFLGTGGGIILTFALGLVTIEPRDKFATVIAVSLVMSAISVGFTTTEGILDGSMVYLVPGMLGGVCGALLLDRIDVRWLSRLFALMVIWAGISFMR